MFKSTPSTRDYSRAPSVSWPCMSAGLQVRNVDGSKGSFQEPTLKRVVGWGGGEEETARISVICARADFYVTMKAFLITSSLKHHSLLINRSICASLRSRTLQWFIFYCDLSACNTSFPLLPLPPPPPPPPATPPPSIPVSTLRKISSVSHLACQRRFLQMTRFFSDSQRSKLNRVDKDLSPFKAIARGTNSLNSSTSSTCKSLFKSHFFKQHLCT